MDIWMVEVMRRDHPVEWYAVACNSPEQAEAMMRAHLPNALGIRVSHRGIENTNRLSPGEIRLHPNNQGYW